MGLHSDIDIALAMRDTVARLVREELSSQRSPARYGRVTEIARESNVAYVLFAGDTGSTPITMFSSTQPSRADAVDGDIVRVIGSPGSYWISDVVYGAQQSQNLLLQNSGLATDNNIIQSSVTVEFPVTGTRTTPYYLEIASAVHVRGGFFSIDLILNSNDISLEIPIPYTFPYVLHYEYVQAENTIGVDEWWRLIPVNNSINSSPSYFDPVNDVLLDVRTVPGDGIIVPDSQLITTFRVRLKTNTFHDNYLLLANIRSTSPDVTWTTNEPIFLYSPSPVVIKSDGGNLWKPLVFNSGYADYGAGFETCGYRLHNGKVELKGLANRTGATAADFSTMATLATGYRPANRRMFASVGAVEGAPTTYQEGRFDITSLGQILWGQPTFNSWLSLENISFVPDKP